MFLSLLIASLLSPLAWASTPSCENVNTKKAPAVILSDLLLFAEEKMDWGKSSTPLYQQSCNLVRGHTDQYVPHDGDVIFVALDSELYQRVAVSTNSWVSHVGILMSEKGPRGRTDWYVYESSPLFGHKTPVCEYTGKASKGRFAIARPDRPLTEIQKTTMVGFLEKHYRDPYHLGFNYHAEGYQYCSKFVHQAYEAIGTKFGSFDRVSRLVDNFDEEKALTGEFGPVMTKAEAVCFWESYFEFCRGSGRFVAKVCEYFGGDDPDKIDGLIPHNRWMVTPESQFQQALVGQGFRIVLTHSLSASATASVH